MSDELEICNAQIPELWDRSCGEILVGCEAAVEEKAGSKDQSRTTFLAVKSLDLYVGEFDDYFLY